MTRRVGPISMLHWLASDRLLRNSTLLMINMGVASLLGFVFWTVAARTFAASSIGLVSATVSLTVLVNTFGGLGMTNTLVRFLTRRPHSSRRLFVDATVITQVVGFCVLTVAWFTPLRPAVVAAGHGHALDVCLVYAFMGLALYSTINRRQECCRWPYKSGTAIGAARWDSFRGWAASGSSSRRSRSFRCPCFRNALRPVP
jgi:hypothetical protein